MIFNYDAKLLLFSIKKNRNARTSLYSSYCFISILLIFLHLSGPLYYNILIATHLLCRSVTEITKTEILFKELKIKLLQYTLLD